MISDYEDPFHSIVLVKRKNPPFVGQWCLPCGYINRYEIPKAAAVREVLEETGLVIRLEKLLCCCSPMPGEINQITISYLARPEGGKLCAGDDASEVRYFAETDCPPVCFRSHQMLISKWWTGRLGEITGQDLD